jgi:hypothetical protein
VRVVARGRRGGPEARQYRRPAFHERALAEFLEDEETLLPEAEEEEQT